MLKRTFELNLPYTVVIYVRMSDKKQNERSPDQQIAEIKRTIKRLKLNWKIKVSTFGSKDRARTISRSEWNGF